MEKPSQMTVFDALYSIAAANGREAALFGNSIELARPAYEKTLIGNGYPAAYLEFPLLEEPRFDLLSIHTHVESGAEFAPGSGFGHQAMFDWFADVCANYSVSCGLELDCGEGETEQAGVYFQQREHAELVRPFLESVGEEARADSYEAVRAAMPNGWSPAYVGLFPGRNGTPLRIGGYLNASTLATYVRNPAELASVFDAVGFTAYTAPMLEQCATLMALTPSADFQFDIMEDGSLGDSFGLSLSFNETKPRDARACMDTGYGAQFMQTLERWGLADCRWHSIADAAFAKHVSFDREDKSVRRLALCVLFNFAKVKFIAGKACPAKFYFILKAAELG